MTASISGPIEVRGLTKHFAAGNGLVNRSSRLHARTSRSLFAPR